ncbi:MAG: EF-hand domain-containing protein [Burkholderiales bacterium]
MAVLLSTAIAQVYAADPPPPANEAEIAARFKAADKNGDGKLTLEEAKAGMPRIAAVFDKIDTDNKGYLTLPQILKVVENQQ